MNKLKAVLTTSVLLLSGIGLAGCVEDDEPKPPGTVVETVFEPTPVPSVSVSVSASTSVKPSISVKPSVDPSDCAPSDDDCSDLPNDGN